MPFGTQASESYFREYDMAKETVVTVHQEVTLEKKGIEINVWEGGIKGGRLVITKSTVAWFAPNAKKATWEGSWEDLAKTLSNYTADCDHCGKPNSVAKGQIMPTCEHCGKKFKVV
jgi:hypothetical protein